MKTSDQVTQGTARAPHRALFYSIGLSPDDLQRPLIGVANSRTDLVPGHVNLDKVAQAVRDGILIYEREEGIFSQFYSLAFRRYVDTGKLRKAQTEAVGIFLLKKRGLS